MKTEEFAERPWEFAARVGKTVDALPATRLGRHVANQLVQSGTAPAMHQGARGKRALFLDKESAQGVQVELTGSWARGVAYCPLLIADSPIPTSRRSTPPSLSP